MVEIKAPNKVDFVSLKGEGKILIFLAGSIEMGNAVDWQSDLVKNLDSDNFVILNPRRDQWDSSWEQSIDNPDFYEQVTWELEGIDYSDIIVFYFDPATKSPISLLELGLAAQTTEFCNGIQVLVCCPQGFYRKGNVDIICERYNVLRFDILSDISDFIINNYG